MSSATEQAELLNQAEEIGRKLHEAQAEARGITLACDAQGISARRIAVALGISNNTASRWVAGHITDRRRG